MSLLLTRKSIRNYNSNYKLTNDELHKIIELANRAPSSQNLQPTRIVVIESKEHKELLRPVLYGNQTQLDTSSAMLVLFTDLEKHDNADIILQSSVDKGTMTLEVKERQINTIETVRKQLSLESIKQDGILDGGMFAMQLMLAAKELGFDTCPIGGFNKNTINEALGISDTYHPLLIVSLGKANEDGYNSTRLNNKNIILPL